MIRTALLIEDNPRDARLLREMFHEQDSHSIHMAHVESMGEAESFLSRQTPGHHPAGLWTTGRQWIGSSSSKFGSLIPRPLSRINRLGRRGRARTSEEAES